MVDEDMAKEKAFGVKSIGVENRELIEEYFRAYTNCPTDLDSSWTRFFSEDLPTAQRIPLQGPECQALRIEDLIRAYRQYGYLAASTDPLKKLQSEVPELELSNLGFNKAEWLSLFPTCGLLPEKDATLETLASKLTAIYASRLGIEYYPFTTNEVANWIQKRFEMLGGNIPLTKEEKFETYRLLSQAELFEGFLHTRFVGQKRFSLEGAETLIPMLFLMFERSAKLGAEEVVLGMSHRGRLNVLANIFQKPLADIITEFNGKEDPEQKSAGDVKYHKGFSSVLKTQGVTLKLKMCHNPSHLESVDAVCEGQVRAKQELARERGDADYYKKVIPVLLHGDAAISGQGVVYETLQLSRLKGYSVGGTIHIVINNQIGFTALPEDSRSTPSCTDIAKAFGYPVFHVNAEDVESCVWAAKCALDLRNELATDVFIDLNCYRKYGHNESDEPAFTQPLLYEEIRKKKSIRELFYAQLLQDGDVDAKRIETEYQLALHTAYEEVGGKEGKEALKNSEDKSSEPPINRAKKISAEELEEIAVKLTTIPETIKPHPRLKKNLEQRLRELHEKKLQYTVTWAFAEALAFGSIVLSDTQVRLVGQDTRRGTFSQRHAAIADQKTGEFYYPLKELKKEQASFDVYDSSLSEFAALGFEYGYSLGNPESLVLWEAQFGDFANGAQIVIDQYVAAGESKWGNHSKLTLLLPHGYEGQGPEHSSARIERFLQLAAEDNMYITNPTTPAQYFHVLRRQAFSSLRRPLIIFTPKALLRHPVCISTLEELATGAFQEVIDDTVIPEKVERVVICQGKIYYDLLAMRQKVAPDSVAIIRLEQLYPFPKEEMKKILVRYTKAQEFLWVQEEPENAGAMSYIQTLGFVQLQYIGRKRSASPAVSSHMVHEKEQKEILESVFPDMRIKE